ncbi:MAG TPA: Hint domain-containing protein, partial [Rhodothermales bacterium]|nr:Hint domain-containing protein [Rhodothermales bacterium]
MNLPCWRAERHLPPCEGVLDVKLTIPLVKQGEGYTCILPGQELQGKITGASKARYSGKAIEIRTASGARLAVTANHPVLTVVGFVAAGDLREGHHLLRYLGGVEPDAGSEHIENALALVDDVFQAILAISGPLLPTDHRRCLPFEFHGDAE